MLHLKRQVREPRWTAPLGAVALSLMLGGCAPPLLSPEEPRSQFDGYDKQRNQHADQYTFDQYGKRQPNLEQRLSPKE